MINTSVHLDLTLNLENYTGDAITLGQNNETALDMAVSSLSNSTVSLSGEVGNYTHNFSFSFEPEIHTGAFHSKATIRAKGVTPGIYFLTISAITSTLGYSKVMEVRVV